MSYQSDKKQRSIDFQINKRLYYVTFLFESKLHLKFTKVNANNLNNAFYIARQKYGGIVANVYTATEWERRNFLAQGFTEVDSK